MLSSTATSGEVRESRADLTQVRRRSSRREPPKPASISTSRGRRARLIAAAVAAADDSVREEAHEARFEAAPAVVAIIALQVVLMLLTRTGQWSLWILPWWAMLFVLVPETMLLVSLVFDRLSERLDVFGHRTTVTVALLAVVSLGTALLLLVLVGSLVTGGEQSGGQLLAKGLVVWLTNVITFGMWFWDIDQGGPSQRFQRKRPPPDFLFPQLSDPGIAEPHWRPDLSDYMYVAFTNAIAFSPTDTLPLTRTAKQLMFVQAGVSAFTVLLVIARSVNILQ